MRNLFADTLYMKRRNARLTIVPSSAESRTCPSTATVSLDNPDSSNVRATDRPEIVINRMPISWDLTNGEMRFFNIPAVLFWLNPSLYRMLVPLIAEIGVDMFRLLVAHSSSEGTDEDYHSMVTTLGSTFQEGFMAWGAGVSVAGWGKFSLVEFDPINNRARIEVLDPWELRMQVSHRHTQPTWGCPFMMGKIIGIFRHAFGVNCWADETLEFDGKSSRLILDVYPSEKTIELELSALRQHRLNEREKGLNAQIALKTSALHIAEQQLRAYSTELEEKVRARTQALEDATMVAKEANKSKSRFLANMSHEIRTPMNGILATLELLDGTELSREQREFASTALESATSLLAILNDILDLSKIEAGKIDTVNQPFAFRSMISRCVQFLVPKAEGNGEELFADIEDEVPEYISGDETRIRQVIINLLSNAIKFTNRGGAAVLVVRSRREGAITFVRFAVIDSGIGMTADEQRSIFDAFTQADSGISRKYGGSGLGLAISKEIVGGMGGSLEVRSRPGVGSCFTFEIPVAPCSELSVPAAAQLSQKPLPDGVRVLLAEDNRVNRTILTAILEKMGCEVSHAENGEEAVEIWKTTAFDVILMDIQMPVMSGLEATKIIRASEGSTARTPIIAVTANAFSEDRTMCLRAGVDDYMTKPLRREQLIVKLQRVLRLDKAKLN